MTDAASDTLGILRDIKVSLRAQLGDATLSLGEILDLAAGAVIPLACAADAPATVMVNGVAVAIGDIVIDDDGALAVELRERL